MDTSSPDTNDPESIAEQVKAGTLSFHSLNKLGKVAVTLRREAVGKMTATNLTVLAPQHLTLENTQPNIENLIGAVELPLGVAGPLLVKGQHARGFYTLPLATTEGALVASVNRGCRAITESGGAMSEHISSFQTRSLLFEAEDAESFKSWLAKNKKAILTAGMEGSKHLKLSDFSIHAKDNHIWLRIKGETGDAMGMNMITIAAKQIGSYIQEQGKARFLSESGNLCVDKKAATINQETGRGHNVKASVIIPEAIVKEVFKTTPEAMVKLNQLKNHTGSELAGALGRNAHHANMVAALFIATGQDAAHAVDGSIGITNMSFKAGKLHAEAILPSLQVGTVGGGTKLPAQQACLQMLSVAGTGKPVGQNAKALAEIIASAVLAGELSLIAALSTKTLAKAHQDLNR